MIANVVVLDGSNAHVGVGRTVGARRKVSDLATATIKADRVVLYYSCSNVCALRALRSRTR